MNVAHFTRHSYAWHQGVHYGYVPTKHPGPLRWLWRWACMVLVDVLERQAAVWKRRGRGSRP